MYARSIACVCMLPHAYAYAASYGCVCCLIRMRMLPRPGYRLLLAHTSAYAASYVCVWCVRPGYRLLLARRISAVQSPTDL